MKEESKQVRAACTGAEMLDSELDQARSALNGSIDEPAGAGMDTRCHRRVAGASRSDSRDTRDPHYQGQVVGVFRAYPAMGDAGYALVSSNHGKWRHSHPRYQPGRRRFGSRKRVAGGTRRRGWSQPPPVFEEPAKNRTALWDADVRRRLYAPGPIAGPASSGHPAGCR